MPTNPLIPLGVRTPNVGAQINSFADSVIEQRRFDQLQGLAQQDREQRNRLNVLRERKLESDLRRGATEDKETERLRTAQDFTRDILDVNSALSRGDAQGADALLERRMAKIAERGGDPSDTQAIRDALRQNPELGKQMIDDELNTARQLGILDRGASTSKLGQAVVVSNEDGTRSIMQQILGPDGQLRTEISPIEGEIVSRSSGLGAEEAAALKVRTAGGETAARLAAQVRGQPDVVRATAPVEAEAAAQTVAAKGAEGRRQTVIADGEEAAKGIPIIKRALSLLDSVETGGIDAVRLQAKQLFGVESADEAELSNNLGKAVLSQLRATFGAQFTEREGARLNEIEAGLGKSTAGNRRILSQLLTLLEKKTQDAISAAGESGDSATVERIRSSQELDLSPGQPARVGRFVVEVAQ